MQICDKCGSLRESRRCAVYKKAYDKMYRESHKEEIKGYLDRWRKENPERNKALKDKWAEANAVTEKIRKAEFYQKNKTEISARSSEYYRENKEKIKAYQVSYRESNPGVCRAYKVNYKARKRENGGSLSPDLPDRLFKLQKGLCVCCKEPLGEDYQLDHIMPVSLGGANEDWNIQLLRATCNNQKRAKHPVEFMRSKGMLI